jgi:hypothetical protein
MRALGNVSVAELLQLTDQGDIVSMLVRKITKERGKRRIRTGVQYLYGVERAYPSLQCLSAGTGISYCFAPMFL